MIISLGYYLGEDRQYKYFESFAQLEIFIDKIIEVQQSDLNFFDLGFYLGKEEETLRKQIGEKK